MKLVKTRKSLRKRSLTKTAWRKLFRRCEAAMIAAVLRRDKVCLICRGSNVLQVDHSLISRKHLSTFFEIRQLCTLCRPCHCNKTFENFGTDTRVVEIVRAREGTAYITALLEKSKKIKKWSIEQFQEMTQEFNGMFLDKNK